MNTVVMPSSALETVAALVGAEATTAPSHETSPAADGTWRLAYLITGDRTLAHRVVDEAHAALAAIGAIGVSDPARLRHLVVARARAAAAHRTAPRELLWSALQRLPRRQRAAIVSRLVG